MTHLERAAIALPLRLTGAVWGHLVGDAMGVPYEFRSPERIGEVRFGEKGTHGKPAGTWSEVGTAQRARLQPRPYQEIEGDVAVRGLSAKVVRSPDLSRPRAGP